MKRQEWEEELNSLDERWGKPYIENYTLNPWSVFGWFIIFAGPKRGRPTTGFSIFIRSFVRSFGPSEGPTFVS